MKKILFLFLLLFSRQGLAASESKPNLLWFEKYPAITQVLSDETDLKYFYVPKIIPLITAIKPLTEKRLHSLGIVTKTKWESFDEQRQVEKAQKDLVATAKLIITANQKGYDVAFIIQDRKQQQYSIFAGYDASGKIRVNEDMHKVP